MDKKTLIAGAVSTLIAVVVTGAVGWMTGVWSQGSAALERDTIEAIVDARLSDALTTDNGLTQAQLLNEIQQTLVRIEHTGELNREDIRDLRNALRALTQ